MAAKIRVTESNTGETFLPPDAIHTMQQRLAPGILTYFYARVSYEIAVPSGRYLIEAVRRLCHCPAVEFTEVGAGITHTVDLRIPWLKDMHQGGWYSGNTHTHYHLQLRESPDDHLRMVPPAEQLDVSALSYLIRTDSPCTRSAACSITSAMERCSLWERRPATTGPSAISDTATASFSKSRASHKPRLRPG